MFDHVEFAVSNVSASREFYVHALAALNISEHFYTEDESAAGFGIDDVTALLIFKGDAGQRKLHICFKAQSAQHVIAAYQAALANGGKDNGAPGYRENYSPGYYAAFTLDPDGNNIEFLFREAASI